MNKKMFLIISGIMILNSCTGLNSMFTTYDPYERKTSRKVVTGNKEKKEIDKLQKVTTKEEKEIKKEIKPVNNELKETESEVKTNIYEVIYTENEKKILKALKEEYSLIDSVEHIEKQTTSAIIKLRREKNQNLKAIDFLIAVNETLKKTKINSYILAVSRTMSTYNSWGKK